MTRIGTILEEDRLHVAVRTSVVFFDGNCHQTSNKKGYKSHCPRRIGKSFNKSLF